MEMGEWLRTTSRQSKKYDKILLLFLLLFLVKGMFYAINIIPPTLGTSPDDLGHISYIQYIASEGKLPIVNKTLLETDSLRLYQAYADKQTVDTEVEIQKESYEGGINWIAQHPPLYYLFMAPLYLLVKYFTLSLYNIVVILRFPSIFFGVLTFFLLDKSLRLLGMKQTARYCADAAFVFSPAIQFYFATISNDGLLILLCTGAFYFELLYFQSKRRHDFYIFCILCGCIMITKYTGALVIIPYLLFGLYKSVREDGWKTTVFVMLRGGALALAIMAPVLIRNLALTGQLMPVYAEPSDLGYHDFTVYEFFAVCGYLNELSNNMLCLIGCTNMITPIAFYKAVAAGILFLSAAGYVWHGFQRNRGQNGLPFACAVILLILLALLDSDLFVCVCGFSLFLIFWYAIVTNKMDLRERENGILCVMILLTIFIVFMLEHYALCCFHGHLRAMHGRYYYIALTPFFYLVLHSVDFIKTKWVRFFPVVLSALFVCCELQTISECVINWW